MDLEPSEHINIFWGNNGAGKTSVLEAIHYLTHGRSFKSSRNRSLIQRDQQQLVVYGVVGPGRYPIGIQRNQDGTVDIRISGERITAVSELARMVPVQVINSDAFLLLEGSPKTRRQFLDWGVFHVEPSFLSAWQRAQKALKNRNILLRSGRINDLQMNPWTQEFITASNEVDRLRQHYLADFSEYFQQLLSRLIDLPDLKLSYSRGWDKTKTLDEVLKDGQDRDKKTGFTHSGPQRADLRIRLGKENAADVLSRGQQKLVVSALKLAQGLDLMKRKESKRCIYLLDDLPAELDQHHIEQICQVLEQMDAQFFITCIDPESVQPYWQQKDRLRLFHVEHGAVLGELDE
jgi:DNA replication and repair protein RecF